jgi:hypothetical protein
MLAFAMETGADPRILVEGESWLEAAFRFQKLRCVTFLVDIGFRVIDVKKGGVFHHQGDSVRK